MPNNLRSSLILYPVNIDISNGIFYNFAGVDVYGAGMGYYLQSAQMKMLTSQPTDIFYQKSEDWIRILSQGLVKPNNGTGNIIFFLSIHWLYIQLGPKCRGAFLMLCDCIFKKIIY